MGNKIKKTKMSNYIVRASLLALLATQSTAITLKTLLEN